MQPPIYFDARWCGLHGIGRFASEIQRRVPGITPLHISGGKLSIIDPLASSLALAGKRTGCFFSPGFNPPLHSPLPVAFTIHDLVHLKVPEESSALRRLYYATVVRPAARRAWRVLTVSEHSRKDIAEWSGLPEASIHVVGNGVSPAFSPAGPRHRLQLPYFLHVGRRAGHKNIPALLRAFKQSGLAGETLLAFTGAPDSPTLTAAAALGIGHCLIFAGDVADDQLSALYRGAIALVYPSLYEGFGLPVIESMACGTPVITSDRTSTREIAGSGRAFLVDPCNTEALAQAMASLATDEELRERLSRRGLERAKDFSWAGVAARVAAALDRHA
jgi:glycosyltransferase involved in cell wall biosynthesis